ncbi:hypothetical protein FPOAC1_003990 [Fusarium poae]|jgi:hypothetical protein|uniref:hypothetical protein n=1 Tax=Fusarium poae TaxID=36050 RepID=UPI001CEAF5BA|nr:hypothetical protein FPOAC1_003990 [Fusarium poae]KAG8670756.1 hypothetical protein FPOAC1_003990 [Fusarium poae]
MQYSRADRQAVYRSSRCKQIFSIPENLALRKQKAIRAVVKRHNLTVSNLSREKLVQILQCLLQEGAFGSYYTTHTIFSAPALAPVVRQEPQAATRPLEADRNQCIMEEHRAWMKDLFHTGRYSDIDLISDTKLYRAHRSIICSMSPVIDRSCNFNAAKHDRAGLELNKSDHGTAKASFNFGDADPEAVDCLIQFFYMWDYEVNPSPAGDVLDKDKPRGDIDDSPVADDETIALEARRLLLHAKIFTLAHIYDVPRLRDLSVKKLREVAGRQWRSTYLLDAAREAYAATPPDVLEMRKAIVQTFFDNRALLDEYYVREFLLEMPHLTLDIMLHMNNPLSSFGSSGHGLLRWQ